MSFTNKIKYSLNITGGNLTVSGSSTVGNLHAQGMTVGNINLTGALFQNGESYASSQWTTTEGNLSYTSGNIEVVDLTAGNLNLTGALYQNGAPYIGSQWTSTAGNVTYTTGTVVATDLQTTNFTVGNFVGQNFSTSNFTASNFLGENFSAGNLVASALNLGVSSVFSGSFAASNNVSAATNVDGLSFGSNISYFTCDLMATIDATTNFYQSFTLSGNKTDAGWNLYVSNIGDASGINFTITSEGQVQYTSTNLAGFVSSTFRYTCTQISESGTYTAVNPSTSGTYIYNTLQVSGTQAAVSGSNNGSLYVQGGATLDKNLIIGTSLSAASGTIAQLVATNVSAGAFVGSSASLSGALSATSGSIPQLVATNVSSGTLNASSGTIPQLVATNVSAGTFVGSSASLSGGLSVIGNSNTLGSLITTGGNVGIGTTSPLHPLDLLGTLRIAENSTSSNFLVHLGRNINNANPFESAFTMFGFNNDWTIWNKLKGQIKIFTTMSDNTLQGIVINTAGNIGLGQLVGTEPKTNLFVSGMNDIVTVRSTGSGHRSSIVFETNGHTWELGARSLASTPSNALCFSNVTNNENIMTLSSNGNVGIGTSSPTEKLHVSGGNIAISGFGFIEFGKNVSGKEGNAGKMGYNTFSNYALDIVGAGTGGTNRFVKIWDNLEVSGNVGIGTSSPGALFTIQQRSSTPGNGSALRFIQSGSSNRWDIGIKSPDDTNLMFYHNGGEKGYLSIGGGGQLNFTGQHRCFSNSIKTPETYIGYIVSANGSYKNIDAEFNENPNINESLPIVQLSTTTYDKFIFGVISDKEEDGSSRTYAVGNFVSVYTKQEDDNRLIINSLGEGAIWVCSANGNVENGDYITTSQVPGVGMKQSDDILHNYTVAKATTSVDFNDPNLEDLYQTRYAEEDGTIITKEQYNDKLQNNENVFKMAFIGCTYHCG